MFRDKFSLGSEIIVSDSVERDLTFLLSIVIQRTNMIRIKVGRNQVMWLHTKSSKKQDAGF